MGSSLSVLTRLGEKQIEINFFDGGEFFLEKYYFSKARRTRIFKIS